MKGLLKLFTVIFVFGGNAQAFTAMQVEYNHFSNGVIEYIPSPQFVVCRECPAPTPLEVLPQVDISVQASADSPPENPGPTGGMFAIQQPAQEPANNPIPEKRIESPALPPAEAPKPVDVPTKLGDEVKVVEPAKEKPSAAVVYFETNKDGLSEESIQELAELKDDEYNIIGYTDDVGSLNSNDLLALKRAERVAEYLKSKGFTVRSVTGKGKCCYVNAKEKMESLRGWPYHPGEYEKLPSYVQKDLIGFFSRRVEIIEITPSTEGSH
ncbi:MAG: OmpA family protein [Nitrospinae bacterium]|nr:OmpA family protein [Nitrospinota bacterium]